MIAASLVEVARRRPRAEGRSMMTVGVLGSGIVGEALGNGFAKHGYPVMRGSREPEKLAEWAAKAGPRATTGTFAQAATYGELVVLAVKGSAAEEVVASVGPAIAGKTVIDATNPIADAPPDQGVLKLFTTHDQSLMERLQKKVPAARFVKAFSCVGSAFMVDPDFGGVRPTMFVCGEQPTAKADVTAVLDRFGWDWLDCGGAAAARAIEPLCMLWCLPGFLRNEWKHAFKWLEQR
jgi:predicted dinucleotide-binding enzyme